ncbi:MAG: HD domain-containing protein, partial [Patescibacteria group bacterium]
MKIFDQIIKDAKSFFENEGHPPRRGQGGSHDFDHVERVLKMCLHIGRKEKADLEILKFAAILHDIGRSEEDKTSGKINHA